MRIKSAIITCAFTLGLIGGIQASESNQMIQAKALKKATYIELASKSNQELEQFLIKGATLVRQREPKTALWFALKEQDHFAIFDVFFNEKGRDAHFAGKVAKTLKDNAPQIVQGGWEQGVLPNISNFDIIASNQVNTKHKLTTASYILLKAKPGQGKVLEEFLKKGAEIVNKTEPRTQVWLALKGNNDTFAIFDAFPDEESKKAHFAGQVAASLQKNAQELVEGGWEKGVLANVHQYEVLAFS